MVRNDIAIEQGQYRVRDVRRGSDIEEGKYLHVWRNRGTGWKLYRVMYNTDVAAPRYPSRRLKTRRRCTFRVFVEAWL